VDNNKDKQNTAGTPADSSGSGSDQPSSPETLALEPQTTTAAADKMTAADSLADSDVAPEEPAPNRTTVKADQPPRRSSLGIWLLVLLVLLSLAASAALVWYGLQQRQQVDQLQQQLQGLSQQAQSDHQALSALGQRQQQLDAGNRSLKEQLATVSNQSVHNEQRLAQLAGSDRQDWLLAEVEYLLRLANQRLGLEHDVSGAAAMLEAADKVLLETRNPAYDAVRAKIAAEIQQLRQVPGVDKVGAIARLQAMQDSLDQIDWLPQVRLSSAPGSAAEVETDTAPQHWYQQLFSELKQGIGQVVRIRRQATPLDIPMAPEQAYYLQQNARLMLEQAQLAMLRGDQNLYDRSLSRVNRWVSQYLPKEDQAVLALRELLSQLQQWQVSPAVPDISGSLQALRARMALDTTTSAAEPARTHTVEPPVVSEVPAEPGSQGAQP
jgi:uroporphyrin-3 C-methyltransferase